MSDNNIIKVRIIPTNVVNTQLREIIKGQPGRDGRDGIDGVDGKDGIDGKDWIPTEAELEAIGQRVFNTIHDELMDFDGKYRAMLAALAEVNVALESGELTKAINLLGTFLLGEGELK